MLKNRNKIFRIACISSTILSIGAVVTAAIIGVTCSKKKENIEKGYDDNDKFIEACLNDNYLRRLYVEKVYPAELQYENGEISKKDLENIENDYVEEAKINYKLEDYIDLSGQREPYEKAKDLEETSGAIICFYTPILFSVEGLALFSYYVSADKREEREL